MATRISIRRFLPRAIPFVVAILTCVASTPLEAAEAEPHGLPPFREVCFGDFDDREEYPGLDELRPIFQTVRPLRGEMADATKVMRAAERRICHVSGILQLAPRWQNGTTMRLSLLDVERVRLYFWTGSRGVMLQYCRPAMKSWGAYGVGRRGDSPLPDTLAVWAVDAGRYRRTGVGTFEVRFHNGRLVLSRGDVVLLSVPLPQPPEEVYFEGGALVRGIEFYRSAAPDVEPTSDPPVMAVSKPASAEWRTRLPQNVTLERLPDGAAELAAGENTPAAQAGFDVPGPDLHEYIFELEEPDVGTGVYLGTRDGRQLARLAFYRDTTTGKTTFAYLSPDLAATELKFNLQREIVPYAGEHQWLKLTLAGGVMKCATSGDGVHFSQAVWSPLAVQGPVGQVGLYCLAGQQARSIRLRSFALRRLDRLSSLAPEAVRRRVTLSKPIETIEDWDAWVRASRPTDVPAAIWQRACILHTLAENPYFSLGGALLHRLLADALAEGGVADSGCDLSSQLKLLEQAALAIHNLDARAVEPFDAYYARLGIRWLRRGHSDTLREIRTAIMQTPIWNARRQNAFPDALLHHAVLSLAVEGRWETAGGLLDSLAYWARPDRQLGQPRPWNTRTQHLLDWARWQVDRHTGQTHPQDAPVAAWRDRLIPQLSKEDFNVVADFRAAVDAGEYAEACRIVAEAPKAASDGLLPDAADRRLLTSLPAALELAVQRQPALRVAMQEHCGDVAQLRLGNALARGDVEQTHALASRFPGTEAAGRAHEWLADRDLSGGAFSPAIGHYRRALQDAPAERSGILRAKLRLAGALLGHDSGQPIDGAVTIGDTPFSAADFEAMIRGLLVRRRAESTDGTANPTAADLRDSPAPARYRLQTWGHVETGNVPELSRAFDDRAEAAAGRIAALAADGQLVVSSPSQIVVFDQRTALLKWKSARQGWPLTAPADDRLPPYLRPAAVEEPAASLQPAMPLWPALAASRMFVRFDGRTVAAYQRSTGRILCRIAMEDHVVADPLLINGHLYLLAIQRGNAKTDTLVLARADPFSGRVERTEPLADFTEAHDGGFLCRAAASESRVVATTAGCVICCDLSGRVDWIRRQIHFPFPPTFPHLPPNSPLPSPRPPLPSPHSPLATRHSPRHRPPLIVDGRVFATQPGVWGVECLDLASGRLLWRKALPEFVAIAGRVGTALILETTDGLAACDIDSGEALWHREESGQLGGLLCGEATGIVYVARRMPQGLSGIATVVMHVDPVDGKVLATSPVETPPDLATHLGPIFSDGKRIWGFFDRAGDDGHCALVELEAVESGQRAVGGRR